MNGSSRGVEYLGKANPDAPYFAIKIQDRIYDIDINFIESFTVERKEDTFGDFSFTILNAADLGLEDKFLALLGKSNPSNMSMQYGWNKGPKSKWYTGLIMDYNPTYMSDGFMKLDVTGHFISDAEDMNERVMSYTGTKISDIVAEIAYDMDWVIEEIEPTTTLSEPRTFRISNVNAVDFIRKELEPIAINSKKEPFKFYLDSYNGQNHIYFVSANKQIGAQKEYNFYVNLGNYSAVLSWSPSYTGGGKQMAGAVMQSAIYDPDTNDVLIYGSEAKSAAKGGASLTVYGSTSPDRMEALLANKWYHENIGAITATLEIVGDPTVMPLMHVNVLPFDHGGNLHLSAGTYLVRKVTDTISGDFRTTLDLVHSGIENGTKTLDLTTAVNYKGMV